MQGQSTPPSARAQRGTDNYSFQGSFAVSHRHSSSALWSAEKAGVSDALYTSYLGHSRLNKFDTRGWNGSSCISFDQQSDEETQFDTAGKRQTEIMSVRTLQMYVEVIFFSVSIDHPVCIPHMILCILYNLEVNHIQNTSCLRCNTTLCAQIIMCHL